MFDVGVGFEKLIILGILALVIIGPEDLPKVMYHVGKWIRKIRAIATEFQTTVDGIVAAEEIKQLKKELSHAKSLVSNPLLPPHASPADLHANSPLALLEKSSSLSSDELSLKKDGVSPITLTKP